MDASLASAGTCRIVIRCRRYVKSVVVPSGIQRQHHVTEQIPAGRVPLAAEAAVHQVFVPPLFQRQIATQRRLVRKRHRHADMRVVVAVAVQHKLNAPVLHARIRFGQLLEIKRRTGHALPALKRKLDPRLTVLGHRRGGRQQIAPFLPTGRVVADTIQLTASGIEQQHFTAILDRERTRPVRPPRLATRAMGRPIPN